MSATSIFNSYSVLSTHVSTKTDAEYRTLLLAEVTRFVLVFCKYLYCNWFKAPKRLSQSLHCLTNRQSWCNNSDSVVYSDVEGKAVAPENLNKNV